MIDYSKLKVGEILSETSYYVVTKKDASGIEATSHGQTIGLGKAYVEQILASADQFLTTEDKSQTDLIKLIQENPRVACSIYFQKQDAPKTKKAYNAEIEAQAADIQAALLAKGMSGVMDILKNPIKDYIPGEMRLIKGYYTGTQDERGRFLFKDMEDTKDLLKAVDSRTTEFVIVNNVKYIKK